MKPQPDDRQHRFEELYRRDATPLLRLAVLLCGDRQRAEDAVADAFGRTWRRWETASIEDPTRYLRRAVVNNITDGFRAQGTRRALARRRNGDDRGPVTEADAVVDRWVVLAALDHLPAPQRAVVVLRYYDDRSEAEIASLLGISPGTVKSRCTRGLAMLARHLRDTYREMTP